MHVFVCNERCSDLSQGIWGSVVLLGFLSTHSQTKSMATVHIHGYMSEWLCLQIYSVFTHRSRCFPPNIDFFFLNAKTP